MTPSKSTGPMRHPERHGGVFLDKKKPAASKFFRVATARSKEGTPTTSPSSPRTKLSDVATFHRRLALLGQGFQRHCIHWCGFAVAQVVEGMARGKEISGGKGTS